MPVWIGFGAMRRAIRALIGRLALGAVGAAVGGFEMPIPGVEIVCLQNPILYSEAQVEEACGVAHLLQRGRLVLLVEPEGPESEEDDTGQGGAA